MCKPCLQMKPLSQCWSLGLGLRFMETPFTPVQSAIAVLNPCLLGQKAKGGLQEHSQCLLEGSHAPVGGSFILHHSEAQGETERRSRVGQSLRVLLKSLAWAFVMQGHHHLLRFSHRSSAYERQGHSFESLCTEHLSRYPNLFAKLTQTSSRKR